MQKPLNPLSKMQIFHNTNNGYINSKTSYYHQFTKQKMVMTQHYIENCYHIFEIKALTKHFNFLSEELTKIFMIIAWSF